MVDQPLIVGLTVVIVVGLVMSTLHPDTDGFGWWLRLLSRVRVDIRPKSEALPPDDGQA
jgi:hypothetical protein